MSRRSLEDYLMESEGISRSEAQEMIRECVGELQRGNYEAIAEILGLEDDYIFDILE